MTNTSISRTFRRHLVIGLAALTAFSSFAGSAVAVKADPMYDTAIESNDVGMDIGHAVVKQSIGCVPVVGQFVAECIDPLLSLVFGSESSDTPEILNRLDEISNQIKQLSAQIDDSTQKVLVKMYRDSLNTFNQDLTSITNVEQDLLIEIKTIEADKNLSEVAKALKIGALLDNSSTDTAQFINKLNTCASYVEGTQAELSSMPDNIFEKAYKINCCSSKLGGEAALKASGYINKVNTILDTGFKLESLIVNSKIMAANLLNDMPADQREACIADLNRYFDGQTKAKALISQCLNYVNAEDKETESNMSSWKIAAGIQNKDGSFTGVKGKYEAICDTENRNSIAAQYNNMVNTVWFDYITEARYNDADNTIYPRYISLSKEMLGTDYQELGINQTIFPEYNTCDKYAESINKLAKLTQEFAGSEVVTGKNAQEIIKSLEQYEERQGHDEKNDVEILADYGFNVTDVLKTNSEHYGVAAKDVNNLSKDELVESTKPILVEGATWAMGPEKGNLFKLVAKTEMTGKNMQDKEAVNVQVFSYIFNKKEEYASDLTYHKLLYFNQSESEPVMVNAALDSAVDDEVLNAQIEAGFANDGDTSALEAYLNTAEAKANENAVVEETQNEEKQPVENEAIVLTVDENNQITGENEGTAWFVDEDGTLNLNNGYKFAFNGDVSNMNMVCSGEITEGHFTNVTLNLTENAVISNAAFDDSEIYYTAGAVINENVVLNNTNLIDATVTNPEEAVTVEAE